MQLIDIFFMYKNDIILYTIIFFILLITKRKNISIEELTSSVICLIPYLFLFVIINFIGSTMTEYFIEIVKQDYAVIAFIINIFEQINSKLIFLIINACLLKQANAELETIFTEWFYNYDIFAKTSQIFFCITMIKEIVFLFFS